MKKTFIIFTLALTLLSCTSCGSKTEGDLNNSNQESQVEVQEAKALAETPLEILTTVWDKYSENDKFPAAGGDFSEENNNPNGPGKYSVADADGLDASLCFPAASASKLEDAASLIHMMNLNTFTSAVFRVNEGEDVSAVAGELSENVKTRQWMCGMPDKYVIYTADRDIIFVLGENELVDSFCSKFNDSFENVNEFINENISV